MSTMTLESSDPVPRCPRAVLGDPPATDAGAAGDAFARSLIQLLPSASGRHPADEPARSPDRRRRQPTDDAADAPRRRHADGRRPDAGDRRPATAPRAPDAALPACRSS